MMVRCWPLGVALALAAGCAKAPQAGLVSGVIRVNGKPLAGATVTFAPIAPEGSIEAGDASSARRTKRGSTP